MKHILILIIGIAQMLPLSADCQEISVSRALLEQVANRLDSFDVLKKVNYQCMSYKDSCNLLTVKQFDLIGSQTGVITNQKEQILLLQGIEKQHVKALDINKEYIEMLKKEKKKLKVKNTISLVGGGVLTVGLTTALLISLLQ